jgi:hypothetical protein
MVEGHGRHLEDGGLMQTESVPDFVVAGAARSGTTGVIEGLRLHPEVFVTQPKEPHYFALGARGANFRGPGDADTINRVAVTDREQYLSLYPSPRGHYRALGEGSVSTLYYHHDAIPELLDMNPAIRVIIFLRDPVERAFSSYQYMRARGLEVLPNFLTALAEEPRRRRENWHHIWHYSGMSLYADSVEAFQKAFPREQLRILFYEDLSRDYPGTLADVLRFLDVPPMAREELVVPRVNISGSPKSSAVQRALKWATAHEWFRSAVKGGTSYRFRERVRRSLLHRSQGAPIEAREMLEDLFQADLARLRTLIQGEVPPWLRAT